MKKTILLLLALVVTTIQAQDFKVNTTNLEINENLHGSLYTPENVLKPNLVILIAGSGPTDRNGNQPGVENNSLKYLAEALAKNGSAVFSYDKSMLKKMYKPEFKEEDLNFNELVADASLVVNYFVNLKKYNKIIIAGHSEGSLVGLLTAQKTKIDAFISIAGTGESIDKVLEFQLKSYGDEVKSILSELKKGNKVEVKNPALLAVFRPSVQPYMMSWLQYDPAAEIKKLTIPVMITNGTKDLQVEVKQAEVLHSAKSDAKYVIIENMNHVLKEIKGDLNENYQSYISTEFPISKVLVNEINHFLTTLK